MLVMLFFFVNQLGWLAFIALLVVVTVLYVRVNQHLAQLRQDMAQLQSDLQQYKAQQYKIQQHGDGIKPVDGSHAHATTDSDLPSDAASFSVSTKPPSDILSELATRLPLSNLESELASNSLSPLTSPPPLPNLAASEHADHVSQQKPDDAPSASIEPDEHSLPMVTSLFNSIKNWFLGGNLVVRVGVLVLLVGVVLLLRLLSEYIEVSISIKLAAIAMIGLALAGLGFKLASKRFAYGTTLQGTGLAITYLGTFFAYNVYNVIASLPSFITMAILSVVTVILAVRQNTFPLALLALSGGFFAPILTSTDTDSLVMLFSYYLLLNVAIATIAHYRPWKILNLLGVVVTFGLAYYWGATENLTTVIQNQRWSLVLLVALHLLLYLFVVIRYAQQIIAYNASNENEIEVGAGAVSASKIATAPSAYLFPIDIGLLFSVPLLAFGLFSTLLNDIPNALTMTSLILAAIYLGLGWVFIKRSERYALITEGMLALGFGFLALVIPLAFNAEWIAFGWSVQGLALVWFGRRSLRAWSVSFGLLLQLVSVALLAFKLVLTLNYHPTLTLTISAISALASVFILRASNSPVNTKRTLSQISKQASASSLTTAAVSQYAQSLGISKQAANQWLATINSQSAVFKLIWHSPTLIRFLTLTAIGWMLYVLVIDFDQWLASWQLAMTTLIAMATISSLAIYWLINRYRCWAEIIQFSHGLLLMFYGMLVLQLPQKFEFDYLWNAPAWMLFISLLIGWLVVGQLWLKTWHDTFTLSQYDSASWFGTGILVVAAAVHYGLPNSQGVLTVLVPITLMLMGLWFNYRYRSTQKANATKQHLLHWFNWQSTLLGCAKVFIPVTLFWVVLTNWSYDGVIWGLPYFPLINVYDITLWLVLLYGLSAYYLNQQHSSQGQTATDTKSKVIKIFRSDALLIALGLISFWIISSMLVRTLHAFIDTPLWYGGSWSSERVQTGLTILWTLLALVATIIASRYKHRALWFMGIGLLGIVVLKLVLVDLSQTEAIWRVISFLGAGSLILLIGYLAPLPPAHLDQPETAEE
ncbi:putative membrane protein [Psychrobacter sp. PL15]|nr:putative membrane protein [Psychrobacter sp. PL15]